MVDPFRRPLTSRAVIVDGEVIGWTWANTVGDEWPFTACLPVGIQRRFAGEDAAERWLRDVFERVKGTEP
jgi:hypothetical protein